MKPFRGLKYASKQEALAVIRIHRIGLYYSVYEFGGSKKQLLWNKI